MSDFTVYDSLHTELRPSPVYCVKFLCLKECNYIAKIFALVLNTNREMIYSM